MPVGLPSDCSRVMPFAGAKAAIEDYHKQVALINEQANNACKGKLALIISDFNGQPYGHSKPSLRGKKYKILHVLVEPDRVSVFVEGHLLSLDLHEIEILD